MLVWTAGNAIKKPFLSDCRKILSDEMKDVTRGDILKTTGVPLWKQTGSIPTKIFQPRDRRQTNRQPTRTANEVTLHLCVIRLSLALAAKI